MGMGVRLKQRSISFQNFLSLTRKKVHPEVAKIRHRPGDLASATSVFNDAEIHKVRELNP
jgi:hypothetical protein